MFETEIVKELYDKYYPADRLSGLRDLLTVHSEMVRDKALSIITACRLEDKVDRDFIATAAMLHDIGIVRTNAPDILCTGELPYICHGIEGKKILMAEGVDDRFGRICERHTGSGLTVYDIESRNLPLPRVDMCPETLEERLICYADKFFSKSGDPRQEKSVERVIASIRKFGEGSLERFLDMHHEFST